MSTESASPTDYGLGGSTNWLLGGAIGGIVGSLLFGALLWVVDPEIVTDVIPGIYGFDTAGGLGWVFHLFHGLVLGVVFGALVSRETILGTITADTQFTVLEETGLAVRFVLAGFVYGLAVWALLPVVATTVVISVGGGDPAFPAIAAESLAGHVLYGILLGALFAVFVDTDAAQEVEAPFEEASDSN